MAIIARKEREREEKGFKLKMVNLYIATGRLKKRWTRCCKEIEMRQRDISSSHPPTFACWTMVLDF